MQETFVLPFKIEDQGFVITKAKGQKQVRENWIYISNVNEYALTSTGHCKIESMEIVCTYLGFLSPSQSTHVCGGGRGIVSLNSVVPCFGQPRPTMV